MRIIARPAFANYATDPGNSALYAGIQRLDVTVIEGTSTAMLCGRADVLHIHWPDNVLRGKRWIPAAVRVVVLFVLLSLQRLRGTKIIWTAHNSFSHEHHHPKLERLFWKGLFRRLDGIIAHSATACADLRERAGRIPICVIPLSHFSGLYPPPSVSSRQLQSIQRIGFIGRIRRYKGVPDLITAFRSYSGSDVSLVIKGKPEDAGTADTIANLCANDCRIDLRFGFLSPQDLTNEVASLDVVILPFKWVTNSGSALLSLSLGTRVVVPNTPYFLELQKEFGSEWVFCFEGDLTALAINEICVWAKQPMVSAQPQFSERRSISWAAKATVEFLQQLVLPT